MTRSDAAPAIPGAISVKDDWEIKRLKWSVESAKNGVWGDDPIGNADDIKCIRVADFNRVKMSVVDIPTIRNVRKFDRNGRLVLPGDLLLEKSGGGEVQPVGAVAMYLGEEPAVCSNFVARVSCAPNTDGRFFLYVHAALYSSRINVRSIKQTSGIQNLDANAYFSEFVAYPPIAVQRDIADFLDRETAEADALVAKYERLIELFEEKRVALVTQAVTEGFDPSVPMKDSGVEWISKIPAHWQVQRLSRVFKTIGSGTTPPAAEEEWYGGDMPFVTTAELRENIIVESAKSVTTSALRQFSSLRVYPPGTLLLAMYGATIGRSAILGVPATVNQACCALGGSTIVSTDFAFKWFQAYRSEITALGVGGGQPNISQDLVRALLIPIPPLDEQQSIKKHLDTELLHIDKLRSRVNNAIKLAKEHRSALITAAVTGQIDVSTYRSNKHPIEVPA